jgi:hypothetical protein
MVALVVVVVEEVLLEELLAQALQDKVLLGVTVAQAVANQAAVVVVQVL